MGRVGISGCADKMSKWVEWEYRDVCRYIYDIDHIYIIFIMA